MIEEETETEEIEVTEEIENQEVDSQEVEEEETEEEEVHQDFQDLGEKAKKKAQKRFNKISGEKYRALEEANIANAKNRELQERLERIENKLSGSAVETPAETVAKPNRDNFEFEEDWIEALTDYKTEQKINQTLKKIETKNEKTRLQKEQSDYQTNVIENFKTKSVEAMAEHDDYLDVTGNIEINLNSPLGKEILDSQEHGAQIMYKLGSDPVLFAKISKKSGKDLTKAIGRIEAELEGSSKKGPAKKKKKAPEPANITRRATTNSGAPNLNTMTPEDYYRQSCGVKT